MSIFMARTLPRVSGTSLAKSRTAIPARSSEGNYRCYAVPRLSWDSAVDVALSSDTVRNAPPYDASRPVDRRDEQKLYGYYGRAGYWEERAAA